MKRMTDERLAEIEVDFNIVNDSMSSSLSRQVQNELLQALKAEREQHDELVRRLAVTQSCHKFTISDGEGGVHIVMDWGAVMAATRGDT